MSTPDELRSALEDALAEDPDDLATHMANADLLAEQGDPRGEFIQTQLALEDPSRPPEERKTLQQRERELLDAHEAEWLGELAPILLGTPEQQRALFAAELRNPDRLGYTTRNMHFRHGWKRGWLDRFECDNLTVEMARKLGRAPIARLLRAVGFRGDEYASEFQYSHGPDLPATGGGLGFRPWEVLVHYQAITNVRTFQYGEEVDPEEDGYYSGTQFNRLSPLIGRMPRLEELYILGHINLPEDGLADLGQLFSFLTLANLRILQYYHGLVYPLEALAANPALGRLTHLLCFPHSFAPEPGEEVNVHGGTAITRDGVRAVVTSPYLPSLTHLQLRCCDGGDAMIADMVASGILGRLRMLDLRHGHVTDEGARLLASCPEVKRLEMLDLINNRLTGAGIAALRDAGIPVRADRQQAEPYDPDHLLYYGDSE